MWGVPMFFFFFFEGVSQLGGANMPPRDVSYLFEGVGAWFPIKFPNSSHQIPLVPINIPSKLFCSHQVPNIFSSNSYCSLQVPIKFILFYQVPRKFPSNSSCSHQWPINVLLFSSSSQTILIKFLLFPSISFCSHRVPNQFPSNSSCSHGYGG